MAERRISRSDYVMACAATAAPGLLAVAAAWFAGAVPLSLALALAAVVFAGAGVIGLLWARDAASLRRDFSQLSRENGEPKAFSWHTTLGRDLARQLDEIRRRHSAELRELELRALDAESVIDALPEPLLVIGRNRRVLHGNLGAEALFGANLAGRSVAEVIRNSRVLEAVEMAMASQSPSMVEFNLTTPVARQMEAQIGPLSLPDEGGGALLLTLRDLTVIRQAEQMRVDFVANVSHELRTPLASLAGFIETLQTVARDDPAGRERFLEIMKGETDRMNRLVDDLLSLSRIEMEEHNPPSTPVELKPIVEFIIDLLQPVAQEFDVTMVAALPDDLPSVIGDTDQLEQVLRNLVENAIKYGRRGGEVRITAAAAGRYVTLSVADQGDGIPRELHHRLTERFYRVEKARSRRIGGTGLGLAIVKHIVNRHRGRLQIESDVGKGSVFKVSLLAKLPDQNAADR